MSNSCPHIGNRPIKEVMANSQLPVLPPGTPYLLKTMASEDIDFRELAAIVEKFPSIAAKLISLANSTWSSPVITVTSLEMACARLGFFVVRSVSVALSIASIFNPRNCPAFKSVHYWADALLTADVCTALTLQTDNIPDVDTQTVRTAGLLHNLGLLWLATWMPSETNRALSIAISEENTGVAVDPLLKEWCGIGFCEAGAYLAEAWKFPELLVTALRYQQTADYQDQNWEIASLTGIARYLIRQSQGNGNDPAPDPRFERLGIVPESQKEVLKHIDSRKQEILELAQTLFTN